MAVGTITASYVGSPRSFNMTGRLFKIKHLHFCSMIALVNDAEKPLAS